MSVIRLFLVLAILAAGVLMLTDVVSLRDAELPTSWEISLPSFSRNPLSPELSETELVIETGDLEVHFERRGAFESVHMVFGGLNAEPRNALTNATLVVLDMDHARAIHQNYPDFHRCSSRGAASAKRQTYDVSVIGIDGATREKLHEIVDLHRKRVRESGDRTCVALSGELLSLSSAEFRDSGRDVSAQVLSASRGSQFLLARSVETPDCASLLR